MGEEPFASGPGVPGAPKRKMRRAAAFALLSGLLTGLGGSARAELELIPERVPQAVFAGGKRLVSVKVRNPAALAIQAQLRSRIYQASTATLAPLEAIRPWKALSLPAGQTAVESFEAEIPQVRAETAFQIVFFDGEKQLGSIQLRAFPHDLLKALPTLAGEQPVGVMDPEAQLEPALKLIPTTRFNEVEDLSASEATLIIIGPMSARSQPPGLAAAVKKKAANGAAIVWIQSAGRESAFCTYLVPEGSGRIVVAPASAITDFSDSPRAQLNLVWLGELATGKKTLELPADPSP